MNAPIPSSPAAMTRRTFLQTTSAAAGVALASLPVERFAHAAGTDEIKIALVGCGGRGTGAANQALNVSQGIKLVALADVSPEQITKAYGSLQAQHPGQVEVPEANRFVGFDAYKEALSLCNLAILATPPGFRPIHFEEAARQGKNAFIEKPVAVDAPGVRRILAAGEEAKRKGLVVGAGLQRHHQPSYLEAVKRLQDGAIGDITSMRCYWLGSARGGLERQPGETEMHYQIRNWYFFTWLSGDHIVEQHIHNIDVINWIKGATPVRAQGMGGRQVRTGSIHGQIFDHHFVEYEYADGSRLYSQCRQGQPGAYAQVSEHVMGTKGSADLGVQNKLFQITGANPWELRLKTAEDGHQMEHYPLIESIQQGKPMNEAEHAARSTMTAILGRMATYSGKQVDWETALASNLELGPKTFAWDAAPPVLPGEDGLYPVAMPGKTVAF